MGRRFTRTDINTLLIEERNAEREQDPRENGIRCTDCPRCKNLWCTVLAKSVKRGQPACTYGKLVIRADRQAVKRGGRKRDGKKED